MDKVYNHKSVEDKIYALWEKSGAFAPTDNQKAKPYCIIMPPPNANDPLHIGHAMFVTIEDILIRYHRMKGDATLWLPGTDHAGIETQFVFEKKLKKQSKSRFDYNRQQLYQMIWDYVQENSQIAITQMKKLGASADWNRTKFTLDQDVVRFMINTFQQLHDDGLVYRDMRLVNYCTRCGTAFSDLEVKHIERKTPLYYMKYGPFTLATTRPETKFGDTAVAVNPKDKRYQKYIGTEFEGVGLLGKFKMKVIADDFVDPEFGTGVAKITPAHDFTDFEVWQRHKNEIPGPKQVIDLDGRLNELTGKYQGLKIAEARKQVEIDLEKAGLLVKIDQNYQHNIRVCYRCNTVIEPLPLPQFFIKVKPLVQKVLKALKDKQVKIYGPGYDKILIHWLKNLKDWNISRQIVWGIRLPVWYSVKHNPDIEIMFINHKGEQINGHLGDLLTNYQLSEIKAGLQNLRAPLDAKFVISQTEPGTSFIQETDTFDTWFSSAQWPIVTLLSHSKLKINPSTSSGLDIRLSSVEATLSEVEWVKDQRSKKLENDIVNSDFNRFYPTNVMETGYDILPFWVMRMLMMGLYLTGKVPFEKIYLHGLIRDEKGQKMSKSKGNVINPLDVVEKYGADALRMALVMSTTAGKDNAVGEGKIKGMRNLTNKIWNAARFILIKREVPNSKSQFSNNFQNLNAQNLKLQDKYFSKHISCVIKDVTKQLDDLKVGLAAETIYQEFWHWFCDSCIEQNKQGKISDEVLLQGFKVFLKLLHPFVPFVTEEIWNKLPKTSHDQPLLLISSWPA